MLVTVELIGSRAAQLSRWAGLTNHDSLQKNNKTSVDHLLGFLFKIANLAVRTRNERK